MDTKTILLKAAELVDEKGHSRNYFVDKRGCVCILGAFGLVLGYNPTGEKLPFDSSELIYDPDWYTLFDIKRAMQTVCSFLEFEGIGELLEWNDLSCKNTVVTVLKSCAASL